MAMYSRPSIVDEVGKTHEASPVCVVRRLPSRHQLQAPWQQLEKTQQASLLDTSSFIGSHRPSSSFASSIASSMPVVGEDAASFIVVQAS
ncbi:DUF4238 domain-containing protein [Sesbania bispinosa]|nr:DUF4238 domain-containing protein [Sesbania bispinosa]